MGNSHGWAGIAASSCTGGKTSRCGEEEGLWSFAELLGHAPGKYGVEDWGREQGSAAGMMGEQRSTASRQDGLGWKNDTCHSRTSVSPSGANRDAPAQCNKDHRIKQLETATYHPSIRPACLLLRRQHHRHSSQSAPLTALLTLSAK